MVHAGITKDEPIKAKRRTVVRGAAWSVPVVAIAATAPAYAASWTPPPDTGNVGACKESGKPRKFKYRFTLPFTGTLSSISILSVSLNGTNRPVTDIEANGTNLVFKVSSTNSADASGDGVIVFTLNNQTYTEVFEYNGTRPCKI